jgi:aminoglycoside phosphotransferase (APT) family kinase protein
MIDPSVILSLAPDADAGRCRLLGEGLWGSVVDLGDGTVLKLIRPFGGLGDAAELWRNETRALGALADHPLPCAVPRLIGHAMTEPMSEAGRAGWVAWIRMSHVDGTALDDDVIVALAPAVRERLGRDLGHALAALHELDAHDAFADPRAGVDAGYLDDIAPDIADVADGDLMAALRASLAAMAVSADTVPNHGDVNSTNILADGENRLAGLIDWAEARRDWAEAEFCHLRLMPGFLAPVRAAYEARRGIRLDDRKLDMSALHNALITVAIARRRNDGEEEAWGLEWAARLKEAVARSS